MSKVNRAIIIRRDSNELSQKYAAMAAESCESHNLPWEYLKAVENMGCHEAYKSVGAKVTSYKNTPGNCCCHSSHINAWKRIVEIGEPCLILEHDAIVKGRCDTVDIPDMTVVTYGFRVTALDEYTPQRVATQLEEISRSRGVHACALTPKTAQWLLDEAMNKGVTIGIDRYLMMMKKSGLPLYTPDPPQVVCWVRQSTSRIQTAGANTSTGHRADATNYNDGLTKGWIEGLKNRPVEPVRQTAHRRARWRELNNRR